MLQQLLPFTVLKPWKNCKIRQSHALLLQQLLPFTVLKRPRFRLGVLLHTKLQQLLPFTVLKLFHDREENIIIQVIFVATALTVYGIET